MGEGLGGIELAGRGLLRVFRCLGLSGFYEFQEASEGFAGEGLWL